MSSLAFLWLLIPTLGATPPAINVIENPQVPSQIDSLRQVAATLAEVSDSLRESLKTQDAWIKPANLTAGGAVLVALLSLLFSLRQFQETRRNNSATLQNSRQSVLLDSLKWFGGGIQNRAIGLAIIDGNWNEQPQLRDTWASVLYKEAVYIVSKPDALLPQHEEANLKHILQMLSRACAKNSPSVLSVDDVWAHITQTFIEADIGGRKLKDGTVVTYKERERIRAQLRDIRSQFREHLGEPAA